MIAATNSIAAIGSGKPLSTIASTTAEKLVTLAGTAFTNMQTKNTLPRRSSDLREKI